MPLGQVVQIKQNYNFELKNLRPTRLSQYNGKSPRQLLILLNDYGTQPGIFCCHALLFGLHRFDNIFEQGYVPTFGHRA